MARELARAPWFLLSLALHAIGLFLLSWLFARPPVGQAGHAPAQVLLATQDVDVGDEAIVTETVAIETNENPEDTPEPQTEARYDLEPKTEPTYATDAFTQGLDSFGLLTVRGSKPSGGAGEDIFGIGSEALRRGKLRGTVAQLRGTGLEIVFVFDSTGSMERVLAGAKRRIFRMVEVLHALVPASRVGIVTYRDRGKGDAYVTREVAVTNDVYRVMNFMHTIDAEGGGDFPEAVLDGLKVALGQRWLPKSRRVVVLIGDAPPHRSDEDSLRKIVQAFARGQAFVHAIVATQAARSHRPDPETARTFASIARAGNGEYALLEAEDAVLQQVLTLAFGNESRRDLDEVYQLVERQTKRTDVGALDLVQRGDLAGVDRALRRKPVDDEVVKAAIGLRTPAVTRFMVDRLGDAAFPAHSRQACSFAVMRVLALAQPPLDPETDLPLRGKVLEELREQLPQ
jgi:Mg-chelatase subunit ChlD